MTDNDIIKALQCCADCFGCPADCPLFEDDRACLLALNKPTLDLINRQKAEIERLTDEKENLRCVIEDLSNNTEYAKAEAVKDFAEMLKEFYTDEDITDDMHCPIGVIKANIDNLVKEMVGECK